ncbi:MAG: hypothetical protein KC656_18640 [Myxococcales bacterium]|nr:hypothetical protein [Myxococcales bacterium]
MLQGSHVHDVHERVVQLPIERVFEELEAMGTPADRIWPDASMPFVRTAGPLEIGRTEESHGFVRARLDVLDPGSRLVWRADQRALAGTHGFEVVAEGPHTRVRHVLDVDLAWWMVPLWRARIGDLHARILEALLDRLEALEDVRAQSP